MAETLSAGDPVVDFRLIGVDGAEYDTSRARSEGLLLLVFWKAGCGTCQYTLPFMQRFHDAYAGEGFRIWGVSQENEEDTRAFQQRFGVGFPQLLDTELDASDAYHLVAVPGIYLLDRSERILRHAPAFHKEELNAMARIAAERTSRPFVPVVREEDGAPDLKPG